MRPTSSAGHENSASLSACHIASVPGAAQYQSGRALPARIHKPLSISGSNASEDVPTS